MKEAEAEAGGARIPLNLGAIVGTVLASMVVGWLANAETTRRDIEERLTRVEEKVSTINEWRAEGGRCTSTDCRTMEDQIRELERRIDTLEAGR